MKNLRSHSRRSHGAAAAAAVLIVLSIFLFASAGTCQARAKDHQQFAALVDRLSEPGGFFDSDNLISNETSYLHVMGKLKEIGVSGGIYVGVGPDQNFSYITRIRPRMAFIIDIRRDNMLEQLMYKSLFERAHNRIEYLCLLFGKPFPYGGGWDKRGIKDLINYIDTTGSDQRRFDKTADDVSHDIKRYYPRATASDLEVIARIQRAFFSGGLDLRYSTHFRPPRSIYPTYRELLLSQDLSGNLDNYLTTEDGFRFLKKMEEHDLVVPVVGDLSGPHALRAVGSYITEQKDHVSAFYVSNVEFYLYREGLFEKFAENLKSLPIDGDSVIIRSYFNFYAPMHPQAVPGHFSTQLLERISDMLKQCGSGDCQTYSDIVTKNSIMLQ